MNVSLRVSLELTLVAGVDRVGRVAGVSASKCVVPFRSDRRTGGDGDDDLGYWLLEGVLDAVADQTVGGDIRDGLEISGESVRTRISRDESTYSIVGGHPDAVDMALVHSVYVHLLEDGVCRR